MGAGAVEPALGSGMEDFERTKKSTSPYSSLISYVNRG